MKKIAVEVYVGFTDHTWQIIEIDMEVNSQVTREKLEETVLYLTSLKMIGEEVVFFGIYSIPEIE